MTQFPKNSLFLQVLLGLALSAIPSRASEAAHVLPDGKQIHLLNAKEGAEAILDDRGEPFFSVLTTLDLSVRMGTALDPRDYEKNKDHFAAFLKSCVRDWTPQEEKAFLEILKAAHAAASSVTPDLIPKKWVFIKTTGQEEGGAFYARGGAIVVPQESLNNLLADPKSGALVREMIHESFHLYSRVHPEKRTRLYQAVGFTQMGSLVLGPQLSKRRMTNPDAPNFSYGITLKNSKGEPFRAILVTYSKVPEFTPEVKGLFSYVTFGLFEVRLNGGSWRVVADQRGDPRSLNPEVARGFFEQIGRNTPYILHPEEILADNVAILALTRQNPELANPSDLPNPELLSKIKAILRSK